MIRHLAGAVALSLTLALAACAEETEEPGGNDEEPAASSSAASPARSSTTRSTTDGPDHRSGGLDRSLVADLEEVSEEHPTSEVSVALAPVGGSEVDVVGDAPALVAWSTIKVPLSLAVLRAGGESGGDVEAALTVSDNAAADRLWQQLGSGSSAATSVEQQLRRGGDERTTVPPEVTVPGYSPFGQSRWRLADQAQFTAMLPCLEGASPVTDAMGRVVEDQRWGLGRIEGARLKGGWGSTPEGYVVRQIGLLGPAKGRTAVTLQVRGGTHEQTTALASAVAEVVARHRKDLPTGSCD